MYITPAIIAIHKILLKAHCARWWVSRHILTQSIQNIVPNGDAKMVLYASNYLTTNI